MLAAVATPCTSHPAAHLSAGAGPELAFIRVDVTSEGSSENFTENCITQPLKATNDPFKEEPSEEKGLISQSSKDRIIFGNNVSLQNPATETDQNQQHHKLNLKDRTLGKSLSNKKEG